MTALAYKESAYLASPPFVPYPSRPRRRPPPSPFCRRDADENPVATFQGKDIWSVVHEGSNGVLAGPVGKLTTTNLARTLLRLAVAGGTRSGVTGAKLTARQVMLSFFSVNKLNIADLPFPPFRSRDFGTDRGLGSRALPNILLFTGCIVRHPRVSRFLSS